MDIVDVVVVAYCLALIIFILTPPGSKPWRRIIKPRSTEVGPSTTKVLEAYELLEGVLLNLSAKDLFVLQRVSSRWCDLIRRSPGLQKRMFLRRDGEVLQPSLKFGLKLGTVQREEVVYDRSFKINPMINLWDPCKHRDSDVWWAEGVGTYDLDRVTNKYPNEMVLFLPWLPQECIMGRKDIPDMLLTQPPIAAITWRYDDNDDSPRDENVMWNLEGLALRDLLNSTKGLYNTHVSEEATWPRLSDAAEKWEIRIKVEAENEVPKEWWKTVIHDLREWWEDSIRKWKKEKKEEVCRFCEFMKAAEPA